MPIEKVDVILIIIALTSVFVIVAFMILFGTFLSKKNKIVTEKLKAELDYQKRIHQTELHALRSQMNPHFVHNSLNAILYYVQQNEVETTEDYLIKFSKLIRMFFDFSRRQFVTIEEEENLLKSYLQIEKLRFEDKFDFKINIDEAIDKEETQIPSMFLQPIVENAINHGLFHKEGPGLLQITFKYTDPHTYQVIIEDDGIGYKAAQKLKQRYTDKVNTHSTQVLHERIDLLNQAQKNKVTYTINDISDTTTATGTKVELQFQELSEIIED